MLNPDFRLHDLVVLHHISGATIWRVVDINGNELGVVNAETAERNPDLALRAQWLDKGAFKPPTPAQRAAFLSALRADQPIRSKA
ncbi:MAG TPA: hypothetical protein VF472_12440 [Burkholderiaceae bacterium]